MPQQRGIAGRALDATSQEAHSGRVLALASASTDECHVLSGAADGCGWLWRVDPERSTLMGQQGDSPVVAIVAVRAPVCTPSAARAPPAGCGVRAAGPDLLRGACAQLGVAHVGAQRWAPEVGGGVVEPSAVRLAADDGD